MAKESVSEILARNIKRLRKERGWLQKDLADRVGFSVSNIARLETCVNWVSVDGVAKLAEAFGVEEVELFKRKNAPPKKMEEALNKIDWAAEGIEEWVKEGLTTYGKV